MSLQHVVRCTWRQTTKTATVLRFVGRGYLSYPGMKMQHDKLNYYISHFPCILLFFIPVFPSTLFRFSRFMLLLLDIQSLLNSFYCRSERNPTDIEREILKYEVVEARGETGR